MCSNGKTTWFRNAHFIEYSRARMLKSERAVVRYSEIAICMEFCDAGSLETLYRRAECIPEDVLGLITKDVLTALSELRLNHKVLHRGTRCHGDMTSLGIIGTVLIWLLIMTLSPSLKCRGSITRPCFRTCSGACLLELTIELGNKLRQGTNFRLNVTLT